MRITELLCEAETEWHIWSRHRVLMWEVEQASFTHGLALRGRALGLYEVYGQTWARRYLMMAVRYLGRGSARLITARDMSETERRRYRQHTAH
jgi:uncharacterized DUF497 family protein